MNNIFLKAPYNRFEEFISAGADRLTLLLSILEENGLAPFVISAAEKNHIVLNWNRDTRRRQTLLSAHYDRAEGSPGANDNGAAVFMLIEAAMELRGAFPNRPAPFFIFTDKEELSNGESIEEQGSYSLALRLKEQGRGSSRVFCFDVCGAGDTLVISTAADHLLKNEKSTGAAALRRRVQKLKSSALEASRKARIEKVQLLPTPFSDDAGFLKAGVAAQTITVLPSHEAAALASLARRMPEIASSLVSPPDNRTEDRRPETWRSLNGPKDVPGRLTTKHWKDIVRFMKTLCETP